MIHSVPSPALGFQYLKRACYFLVSLALRRSKRFRESKMPQKQTAKRQRNRQQARWGRENLKTEALTLPQHQGQTSKDTKLHTNVQSRLQDLRTIGEPSYLSNGASDVLIDGVGDLCSLHSCSELHGEHTWVVPQPPVVGLVTSQACAVDAGLLACPDANDLKSAHKAPSHPTSEQLARTSHKLVAPYWIREKA